MPGPRPIASPFVAILAALALAAPAPAPAEAPGWPPDALLLFVAGWCAPCHAELREVDALAAAAAPRRLLVVPVDSSRATAAMLAPLPPVRIWRGEAAARALWSGELPTAGLPLAVLTDGEGRICADHRQRLHADQLTALAGRCTKR